MALICSRGFTLATRQQKPVAPPSSSSRNNHVPRQIHFKAALTNSNKFQTTLRRSADYKPPTWSFESIQSLKSEYQGEPYTTKAAQLKEDVRLMFEERQADGDDDLFHQLELIDSLQRLGLSYHFENEIKTTLERLYDNIQGNHGLKSTCNSLHGTSLAFRLLRQHGKYVPQENFSRFIDKNGKFKSCLSKDYKGLLHLYEASFLSMKGENIFEEAKEFTEKHLKEYAELKGSKDPYLSLLVNHALEFPLHWRMVRMEARQFIDIYHQNPEMNSTVLDLAKLDFNLMQATYQEDLKHASRWWKRTGLGENLGFIRERTVECFLWTAGILFQPQYGYCRRMVTQFNTLITALDDVYDVYGTLDELELFTNVVERWDINALEELPDYMKLCFFALYNSVNGMASDILSKQGLNTLPYTKKLWADLCKAYLLEAKWYHNGYTPTLQEYIDNGITSIGAPLSIYQAYIFVLDPITKEGLEFINKGYPNILKSSSIIGRLANDLATSQDETERDIPKSIQCYMHESGVSREEAREYIWNLIDITMKDMNKHQMLEKSFFSRTMVEAAINATRMSLFVYMYGDGHSSQDHVTKNRMLNLLVKPVV